MRIYTIVRVAILCAGFLATGCGSSSGLRSPDEWRTRGSKRVNADVIVYVNTVDIHCRLLAVAKDKLTVSIDGKERQIPASVVSRVVFSESESQRSRMIIGTSIGTVLGGVAGYFVGREANSGKSSVSNLGHPLSVLLIVGGAAGGAWFSNRGSGTEQYELRGPVQTYTLHESVGHEITPAELKMYGLFPGVINEDDQLLQVQAFKIEGGQYFLLLDVRRFGEYVVDWLVVDEAYMTAEKSKIK